MENIYNSIKTWLAGYPFIYDNIKYLGVLLLAYILYFITKKIVFRLIKKFTKKTKTTIDDLLFNTKVIKYLSYIPPLYIINIFAYLGEDFRTFIQQVSSSLILMFILLSVGNVISTLTEYYERNEKYSRQPIKGYAQVAKIILYIFGAVFIAGIFTGQNPFVILTGLGALSAVLILVFKDTILGFVTSIQISTNELIKIGDWIEIPSFDANGAVVDISLHTIKVQNWDKTFTLLPTYKLIENSFKNWQGMLQSGGRRIKRNISIDMNSIKFIDDNLKQSLLSAHYINEAGKKSITEKISSGGVELTNLGLFLNYLTQYIGSRDDIREDLIFLAHQLEPTASGLPVEIIAFCNQTGYVEYDKTQNEIFEHIFAVIQLFGLRVFQNISGENLENAAKLFGK